MGTIDLQIDMVHLTKLLIIHLNVSSNDILENNRKIEQQYNNAMLKTNIPSEYLL